MRLPRSYEINPLTMRWICDKLKMLNYKGGYPFMKRIKTIETRDLKKSVKTGGCGECQTSCQSACKTSCGVANQQCEKCMSEK